MAKEGFNRFNFQDTFGAEVVHGNDDLGLQSCDHFVQFIKRYGGMGASQGQQHINLAFKIFQMIFKHGNAGVAHMQEADALKFKMIKCIGIRIAVVFLAVIEGHAFPCGVGFYKELVVDLLAFRRQLQCVDHDGFAFDMAWIRVEAVGC